MRSTKNFRVWHKPTGQLVYPKIITPTVVLYNTGWLSLSDCDFMQSTGRMDPEQTEIFEGDITLYIHEDKANGEFYAAYYVVEFRDGCFGTRLGSREGEFDFQSFRESAPNDNVVGNQHTHPELYALVEAGCSFTSLEQIKALGLPYQSLKTQQIEQLLSAPMV